jgi:hypothetical protein
VGACAAVSLRIVWLWCIEGGCGGGTLMTQVAATYALLQHTGSDYHVQEELSSVRLHTPGPVDTSGAEAWNNARYCPPPNPNPNLSPRSAHTASYSREGLHGRGRECLEFGYALHWTGVFTRAGRPQARGVCRGGERGAVRPTRHVRAGAAGSARRLAERRTAALRRRAASDSVQGGVVSAGLFMLSCGVWLCVWRERRCRR